MQKVAIVYDRINKWGGAERVLLALHEIFPKAPIYTSVYDSKNAAWAKVFPAVKTSFLQKLPFAKSNHELLPVFMPLAFASFDFSDFDLVISVTSEAAKGIRTNGRTLHICYCLTPTRYLWSGYKEYFKGRFFKLVTKPIVNVLRKWDKKAAQNPNLMVAISGEVKERIKKYYKRNSIVIYPPVNIANHQSPINKRQKRKYYLLVSRLDFGYKKVDLAIKAFNKLDYPLVIVGTGREKRNLKRMAGKNIKFVGKVSEKKLADYYRGAKALIMPQEEDFGIVAVEAQSFGVPVIAYIKGGSNDTVIDGKTGILFGKQNVESLLGAIGKFEKIKYKDHDLYNNASRFSKTIFRKNILALINKYSII
jgi:glycosyltransferase involved in cell wall biosynthesis